MRLSRDLSEADIFESLRATSLAAWGADRTKQNENGLRLAARNVRLLLEYPLGAEDAPPDEHIGIEDMRGNNGTL